MAVELFGVTSVRSLQNATEASQANRDAGQGKKNQFTGVGGRNGTVLGRPVTGRAAQSISAEDGVTETRAYDGVLGRYVDELV